MAEERRLVEISDYSKFIQFLSENPVVIMKAHATWCGPCKTIQPFFEEKVNELPTGVSVVYVDVDKASTISRKYRIRSVPCMISFFKGQPYDVVKGANGGEIFKFFEKVKKRIGA